MTGHRVSILRSHEQALQQWLTSHPSGHERGAVVLFRRFDRPVDGQVISHRFVSTEIIQMTDEWIVDSSPTHLRINMRMFVDLYFRCETEGLELGFAHSHPNDCLAFSEKDDTNEQNILRGYSGCNGEDVVLVSLVLSGNKWCARTRNGSNPGQAQGVRHIAVLGESIDIQDLSDDVDQSPIQKRQEAAFGKPFNKKLQSLRATVVGVGGTGSAVATLLARAGIGELILIDGDNLEDTNLNRVRGFRKRDIGKNKALLLSRFIENLGLDVSVSAIAAHLHESESAIDALSSSDIVFGCTDDVAGRDLMNQALYYYGLAYIDTGLTGKIDIDDNGDPYLRDHRGRISCILPECGSCLRCQRVVTDEKLTFEQAMKERPELRKLDAETLEREYYLTGGGEPAPGVGPFTSATADSAVATLMNLLRPYRRIPTDLRADNIWHDFVHMSVHSNEPMDDDKCIYCRLHLLLLRQEKTYRLDMPTLGKLN